MIEIEKKFTYEKNIRAKVMILYAIDDEAKEIDSKMIQFISKRVKYVSYKYTSLAERLAAIYTNEIMNMKFWFETFHNVKMKDKVLIDKKEYYLDKLLMFLKVNKTSLFLAIE